jgi:hypothetical protein
MLHRAAFSLGTSFAAARFVDDSLRFLCAVLPVFFLAILR